MDQNTDPDDPPLGSWPKTYALACAAAMATIALLYWLTAAFDRGAIR